MVHFFSFGPPSHLMWVAGRTIYSLCGIANWYKIGSAGQQSIPDNCHRHHMGCLWRKSAMWRNFPRDKLWVGDMSPHSKIWRKIGHVKKFLHMINVENFLHMRNVEKNFKKNCRKICSVAIYAVLSQNLFCCNLRIFAWRKFSQKLCLWRQKRQISGMQHSDIANLVGWPNLVAVWHNLVVLPTKWYG